ncbi:methylated-DNA--[protein]-cysteine S-methyltransferase [Companilactobacillus zhongbaensis]|uniref:methylated-DNA--[protein]-cysteine S-methyltransferase n=1 Tax=Companilactobacillus zhongbaensis TaxID=2486009 RepID=UPI000F766662|nr:methylated-DNA--[protein]-cysteine S-methyltransferase [Companilactobacillus zhongbaensis]
MLSRSLYSSPLGDMTILTDSHSLLGLWFDGQTHFGGHFDLDSVDSADDSVAASVASWLDDYFAGKRPSISDLSLDPQVTAFQKRVLDVLCSIPYGSVWTYRDIARELDSSPRAVGGAVGRNPISIIIPCHRVIATDGSLTGYAGGISRKIALLELEGISLKNIDKNPSINSSTNEVISK